MAKVYRIQNYTEWEQRPEEDWDDYYLRQKALMEKIQKASDALPEGKLVGFLLSTPVADGEALYVVHSTSPLQILHVPYMDAYRASPIWERGLRLTDVKRMQKEQRRIAKLFAA